MKQTRIIFGAMALMASLMSSPYAMAGEKEFSGEVTVTGKYKDISGNEAKANEYRDKRNGGLTGIQIEYDKEKQTVGVEASDIGYDTQEYHVDAHVWGVFDADVYYNEMIHNVTFDARTFFSGAGTARLTGPAHPDPAAWHTFDYQTQRKKFGTDLRVNLLKPFYLDVSYSRDDKEGIKPAGMAQDTGNPSEICIELPQPIDYATDNLNLEVGYAKTPLFLSLTYFNSEFANDNAFLKFENPVTTVSDALSLPPDNSFRKFSFKGAVNLPLMSKFSVQYGKGKSESNDIDVFSSFDGSIDIENYKFVLTSKPLTFLEGRLIYKSYERSNESKDTSGITDEFFSYKKSSAGVDLGWRIPANFFLDTAYTYVSTKRDISNIEPESALPYNKDNIYSVDLRWTGLDFMTLKVGYEKLKRDADYQTHESQYTPADRATRFAYAGQDRDTFKVAIDVYPLDNLNFGFEYRHCKADYEDTLTPMIGLRTEKRDQFDVSGDYLTGKYAKIMANIDYERINSSQYQATDVGNWTADTKDETYGFGVGADIFVIPNKLTVQLRYDYINANGSVDYTFFDPAIYSLLGINPDSVIDLGAWDDCKMTSLKVRAIYAATKSLTLSVAYIYEHFEYSDARLNDYAYVPATSGSNGAYLTGAFNDPSYNGHSIFLSAAFRF